MYPCPSCGKQTDGTWSEGGAKWDLCEECMEREGLLSRNNEERSERVVGE